MRIKVHPTLGKANCIDTPAAHELEELYIQNLRCFVFQTDGQTNRQMEMLILIPMIKIYVFLYSRLTDERTDRQTDKQTDRDIHPLRVGWRNFFPLS